MTYRVVVVFAFVAAVGWAESAYPAAAGHLTQLTFEAASNSVNPGALAETTATNGPCTRTTSSCASGTGCYRFNPNSEPCSASKPFTGTSTVRAFARIRAAAYPSGIFGYDFFSLSESVYGTGVYVEFTQTNQLRLMSYGSGAVTDYCGPLSTGLALNTWYGIRVRATKSDTATVSLDLLDDAGAMLDTVTCTNQPAGGGIYSVVRVGTGNGFGATADINIDDVDVHNDTAWPGAVRWVPLEPTLTVSCALAPVGPCGGGHGQCVDENPPPDGDTTYLLGSDTSACTFQHPTTGAKGIDEPIHGTLLWWSAKLLSGTPTMAGHIGSVDVSPQPLSSAYASYFAFNLVNPVTQGAWTRATLDATAFGVRNTTASTVVGVTATRLIVGFEDTPPMPTPTPTTALFSLAPAIQNPTPASGDAFGTSVSTAGGYVVIGAPSKSAAYLYDHVTGELLRTLQSPNPSSGDGFGTAVAGEGKNVAVGAPGDDSDGTNVGAVYFFDGLTGAVLKTFRNPNPPSAGAADDFGAAVSVAGSRIVVAAPGEDTNGPDAGAVYVFDQGTAAQPNGELKHTLKKPTPVGTSDFGTALDAFGSLIIVGDPADSAVVTNGGAAYVYVGDPFFNFNSAPILVRKPTPIANDRFGAAVAGGAYPTGPFSAATRAIVGAPGDDGVGADAGAVYAFDVESGSLVRTWTKPGAAAGDQFGAAVTSVRGRHTLIGTPFDDASGSIDGGAAYLFDLETGAHLRTFANPDPQTNDRFAAVVSGGRHALIAAPHDGSAELDSGAAYVFERGLPFCANNEPAALIGAWSPAKAHPAASVHTILTSENTVLFFQGSDIWTEATPTFIWDIASGAVREQVTQSFPNSNLFCSGHAPLKDGRILVIGGTAVVTNGIATSFALDPITETWTQMASMQYPRWYPTATALNNGRILATLGHISGGSTATVPEIYDALANTWTAMAMTASKALPLYPFMFLLPSGKVLYAGGPDDDGPVGSLFRTYLLDLTAQTWSTLPNSPIPGGSAAMFAPGQVIKSGGENANHTISTGTAWLDATAASPTWVQVDSMDFARTHHNLVILPDGNLLAVGGASAVDDPLNAVMPAELLNATTKQWSRVACMPMPRMYHSSAVLLPDGRVLSQGADNYPSYQIYSPAYLFAGPRPTVNPASVPTSVTYGQTFAIETPDGASITSTVFMRTGAATHGFDQNQRRVPLLFTTTSGGLSITAPSSSNIAPPGYYMLFILNGSGAPSEGFFVHLDVGGGCG